MVFACQSDSFKKTLISHVKSCSKLEEEDYYEVVCEDSILFPEGGGQPWDTGYINNIRVHKVLRRGNDAVMYVEKPLTVGDTVKQTVDWERRLDHMQQHSGQHLITAIINAEYGIETTSWWLGEKISHIELKVQSLTDEQILNIERLSNEKIFEQVPVVVKFYESGDARLQNARTRGLPQDVKGPLRVVEIVGLEDDLCCGTHVSNLGQLQCIKLMYAEKGKRDRTNLYFLSGVRVLQYLSECLDREMRLTRLLNNEPSSHADMIQKLQQNVKTSKKKLTVAFRDLGMYEAQQFLNINPKPKYYCHHNKDGDSDYLDSFVRTILESGAKETLLVLVTGEDKGTGNLVVMGKEEDVKELGPQIAEVLDGKGAAHGSRFKGKINKPSNMGKVETLIKKYFEID